MLPTTWPKSGRATAYPVSRAVPRISGVYIALSWLDDNFANCEGLVEPVDCTKYITWPSEHQLLPLYSYQFFRRHTSINLVFLSINSYRRHVLHFFQGKDICLFFAVRVSLHIYT